MKCVGKVIDISTHRGFGKPDPDTEKLLDWLGDDVFLIKAVVQVQYTAVFEAGQPDEAGFVADTHGFVAQGLAAMPWGPAQPVELHFESQCWETLQEVQQRLQPGAVVYVAGTYFVELTAHPPFLSIFLDAPESIEPLPPGMVPTALRWLEG